jgi:Legionella pneumophila major outer membrane protein precursor
MTRGPLLIPLTLLAAFLPGTTSYAQSPGAPVPLIVVSADTEAPNPLPDLPRLPDEPRSLFAPPPPPGPPGPPLPGPYFEDDPRLDPPILPLPGWFADVETEIAVAHVKNKLVNTVPVGGAAPNTVALPSAELDWTVAPRFELGYRLPSGFGAFALAYRFLTTEGTQGTVGADGPASLHSRLELNEVDFDYVSREFSLWPLWEMQWRFGGRLTELFFDSRADEPFAEAAAGSGIFESRVANGYVGFGPHWGVQLVRQLDASGFSLVGAVDGACLLGRLRQGFFEASTTPGPTGLPLLGETRTATSQAVPMLNTQAGIGWKPPAYPQLQFFLGYEYEYWWNVGRDSLTTSRGELSDQGVYLRAQFNF